MKRRRARGRGNFRNHCARENLADFKRVFARTCERHSNARITRRRPPGGVSQKPLTYEPSTRPESFRAPAANSSGVTRARGDRSTEEGAADEIGDDGAQNVKLQRLRGLGGREEE